MVHHNGSNLGLDLCSNGSMGLGLDTDWLETKVDGEEKNGVGEESNDSIIETAKEKAEKRVVFLVRGLRLVSALLWQGFGSNGQGTR